MVLTHGHGLMLLLTITKNPNVVFDHLIPHCLHSWQARNKSKTKGISIGMDYNVLVVFYMVDKLKKERKTMEETLPKPHNRGKPPKNRAHGDLKANMEGKRTYSTR